MAKENEKDNKIVGKVGNLVYLARNGKQIVRSAPSKMTNPRTALQMQQRLKWNNALAVYKSLQPHLKGCFETKSGGQTDYNCFMGLNLNVQPVYLTKEMSVQGAAIVAPYIVSQGVLPSITVGGTTPATDIALGGLVIDDSTTVAELAEAVVRNNKDFLYNDHIVFFKLLQQSDEQDGLPYIRASVVRVCLACTDTSLLRDVAPADGFSSVNGYLGADEPLARAGVAWMHSRTVRDKVHVSSQQLVVANDLLGRYTSPEMLAVALASYGSDKGGER